MTEAEAAHLLAEIRRTHAEIIALRAELRAFQPFRATSQPDVAFAIAAPDGAPDRSSASPLNAAAAEARTSAGAARRSTASSTP